MMDRGGRWTSVVGRWLPPVVVWTYTCWPECVEQGRRNSILLRAFWTYLVNKVCVRATEKGRPARTSKLWSSNGYLPGSVTMFVTYVAPGG